VLLGKSKVFVVVLLLLVFVDQALATAMVPCEMQTNAPAGLMLMDDMDHSIHSSNQINDSSDTGLPDCCETDGNCTMGTCLSAVVPTALHLEGATISFKKFSHLLSPEILQPLSSLYRPPISR
jgi:hypothetical protein